MATCRIGIAQTRTAILQIQRSIRWCPRDAVDGVDGVPTPSEGSAAKISMRSVSIKEVRVTTILTIIYHNSVHRQTWLALGKHGREPLSFHNRKIGYANIEREAHRPFVSVRHAVECA